ncbi:LacI family DNA-binding transcriptional regulator [Actinomadura parmotrematis]|uniref:LacI family transcriptional regulator n=1 Tax=Actinomadura parmotrematis TaxID=2864039 RepID=A0ABS7FMP6_9ACTN|nr:LacI family DNA-binding transcriptional regulator [Actinomadura parmotrematis]MBW8481654.1 LacI family transcriptional regulator [Actinomadura parmotrematis]
MPGARPTSRDVARAAGVSQSTVSLVLGGKWEGRISPATAGAVRAAADRLGYRPNLAARSLRLGTTRTVLLMIPTLSAPFFGAVHAGAARVAAEHGFGIVVLPWPDDAGPARSPFAAPHEAIDGILASSLAVEAVARFPGTPAVMLDSDPAGPTPTVDFDVAGGMAALAAHLGALGHRRVGHVAAAIDQWTFRARGEALAAAVRALPGGSYRRAAGPLTVGGARAAALGLLDAPDPPTALVCDDDAMAAGAYKAARARGLAVPGDLSVTGFDDDQLATALEPELTTVRLPAAELGARGMAALLELLGGGAPAPVSLPGRLVVRGSTAPPPHDRRTGGIPGA